LQGDCPAYPLCQVMVLRVVALMMSWQQVCVAQ
jgi:hypothetical protein